MSFLQALFLHSGQPVSRYSDPLYDDEPTRLFSFELLSHPLDAFQGHGEIRLSNILPLPQTTGKMDNKGTNQDKMTTMGSPSATTTTATTTTVGGLDPLATTTTVGLDPRAHLYVWDELKLEEGQTMKLEVIIRTSFILIL